MNIFDIAIGVMLIVVTAIGYRAGLMRSAMSILGYVAAMPIAIWATSLIAPQANTALGQPLTQSSLIFIAAFLVAGVVLGMLLRLAVNDMIGDHINLADRLGGAALGAARVTLIAVTLVMIFDRLIPANAEPSYLVGSKLRPLLSSVAAMGVRSMPPELIAQIDRLKRDTRM
jgi:membrane protein required for colicin V production